MTNPNAIIWFSGDLNLLNIDWNLNCLQGNNYPSTLCMTFLDTLLELDLSQIVTFPTRQRNILDIFITNQPTLVKAALQSPELVTMRLYVFYQISFPRFISLSQGK